MRALLTAGLTLALLVPAAASAQTMPDGGGQGGPPGGGPPPGMQRPPRIKPPEPIARKDFDRAVEKLFRAGDADRDGQVTRGEVAGMIEARKTRVVAERFAAIDADRNQAISMAEFAAWQGQLGSAVLDEGASAGRPLGELVAEEVRVEFKDDMEGQALSRLIEPLNAVMLATANTDYDGGVSLAELLAYQGRKFDAADTNKDGWLTMDEIQKLAPGGPGGPGDFRRPPEGSAPPGRPLASLGQ